MWDEPGGHDGLVADHGIAHGSASRPNPTAQRSVQAAARSAVNQPSAFCARGTTSTAPGWLMAPSSRFLLRGNKRIRCLPDPCLCLPASRRSHEFWSDGIGDRGEQDIVDLPPRLVIDVPPERIPDRRQLLWMPRAPEGDGRALV